MYNFIFVVLFLKLIHGSFVCDTNEQYTWMNQNQCIHVTSKRSNLTGTSPGAHIDNLCDSWNEYASLYYFTTKVQEAWLNNILVENGFTWVYLKRIDPHSTPFEWTNGIPVPQPILLSTKSNNKRLEDLLNQYEQNALYYVNSDLGQGLYINRGSDNRRTVCMIQGCKDNISSSSIDCSGNGQCINDGTSCSCNTGYKMPYCNLCSPNYIKCDNKCILGSECPITEIPSCYNLQPGKRYKSCMSKDGIHMRVYGNLGKN
jgi:hypothetical protein